MIAIIQTLFLFIAFLIFYCEMSKHFSDYSIHCTVRLLLSILSLTLAYYAELLIVLNPVTQFGIVLGLFYFTWKLNEQILQKVFGDRIDGYKTTSNMVK